MRLRASSNITLGVDVVFDYVASGGGPSSDDA